MKIHFCVGLNIFSDFLIIKSIDVEKGVWLTVFNFNFNLLIHWIIIYYAFTQLQSLIILSLKIIFIIYTYIRNKLF